MFHKTFLLYLIFAFQVCIYILITIQEIVGIIFLDIFVFGFLLFFV